MPGKGYWILLSNTDSQTRLKVYSNGGIVVCSNTDSDSFAIESGARGRIGCNDINSVINPGVQRVSNGLDADCDSAIDEGNEGGCIFTAEIIATGQLISGNEDYISKVTIGIAPYACTLESPPFPPPYYTAVLKIEGGEYGFKEDIRSQGYEKKEWELNLKVGNKANPNYPGFFPVLSWDPNLLCPPDPNYGYLKLYSEYNQGVKTLLIPDMNQISQYQTKEEDGQCFGENMCVFTYYIVFSNDVSVGLNLPAGWSMISLPLIPNDATPSVLFPEASVLYSYKRGSGYTRIKRDEDLQIGDGYWMLLYEDQNYVITGQPIHFYNKAINEDGWSMIGGCTNPAQASAYNAKIDVIYRYAKEAGYQRVPESEKLLPGKGYWILLSNTDSQTQLKVDSNGGDVDCSDIDGDSFAIEGETCGPIYCDDGNPAIHPGASEVCDGKDNDCDGVIDDPDELTYTDYYRDADSDGYGDPNNTKYACKQPGGYVQNTNDCNDTNASINPGTTEICGDGTDQDCNGEDPACPCTDADGDGFAIEGDNCGQIDCDDSDKTVYPDATETCEDGIDQDCDGEDLICCTDADEDGFFAEGGTCGPKDCDDTDSGINPSVKEECEDGIDQDCNGEDLPCILEDADGDLWAVVQGDCDDTNPDIFPGATDFPGNGVDEDCDGQDDISPRLADMDFDGYTAEDGDCHDQNPQAHPGATEIPCNGIDEDCDDVDQCDLVPALKPESGFIDGEVFNARTEEPLEGATIKMPYVGKVHTNTEGKFSFPTPKEGWYSILIEKEGYTYAQRSIWVESGYHFAVEPVYLVPIDPVTATISPEDSDILINSTNDVEIHFELGSVVETVNVSVTRFYEERELPSDLPPASHFTTAVELLPDGLTLEKPIRLLVENTLDFAPGTPVPVGYYRKDLGRWVPDGMGKITDDGLYIEYYLTHFSPCDLNLSATEADPNAKAATNENAKENSDRQNEPKPCNQEGNTVDSKVVYHDGELMEDYHLPSYQSLGRSHTVSLVYTSNSANPKSLLSLDYDIDPDDMTIPEKVEFKVSIGGKMERGIYTGEEGNMGLKYLFDGMSLLGEQLPNGSHPYSIELTNWYPSYYNLARRFGDPGLGFAVDSQGIPIRGPDIPFSKKFRGRILINNQAESPIGAGWNIAELQRIYGNSYSNSVTLVSGSGGKSYFKTKEAIIETFARDFKGPAIQASLSGPSGVAVDGEGNVYIADTGNNRIRRINPVGIITTIAGTGTRGYSGDGGPATQASLSDPRGVAVDGAGNVYISDRYNNCIRRVDTTGIITTIAGYGLPGYSGDGGPATQASLSRPEGVAVDESGNVYIADYDNHRIRRVDTIGIITTIAGNGTAGYSGDGGPATQASLNRPEGVAVDESGNVYIADSLNCRIRRIDPVGIITTFAGIGGGHCYDSGDGGPVNQAEISSPFGVEVDGKGNVYIAAYSNCIRRVDPNGIITTIAGNGTAGYSGDGGPATQASLYGPPGVAVDGAGNVYIADRENNRIRRVDTIGIINTIAGNGSQSIGKLFHPEGVAVDGAGNVYIADYGNHHIRRVDAAGNITIIAGTGIEGYSGDGGPATQARLDFPSGVAVDRAGNVYIADYESHRIRRINPVGIITTIAGNGTQGYSGDGGPATQASLNRPEGVAVDESGNVYIADTWNHCIRRVNPAGIITTIAGTGTSGYSGDGGPATQARIAFPEGVAVDGSGNVYISDTNNHRIRRVDPAGIITTIAGNGTTGYTGDGGPATQASLHALRGVAVDEAGNVYIADAGNYCIRILKDTKYKTKAAEFISPEGDYSTLTRHEDGTYTRIMKDGTTYHFNADGLQVSKTETNEQTTTYDYDDQDRLTSITDPAGLVTTFTYSGYNLASIKDPAERTTQFFHDDDNNLTSIIAPDGSTTSFTYDSRHLLTSKKDHLDRITTYHYDDHGMIENVVGPDKSTNQYSPSDGVGLINELPEGVGTYDNPAKPLTPQEALHIDAEGNRTYMRTDKYGRLLSKTDHLENTTTYERGCACGAASAIHYPNGASIQKEYDDNGNLISFTNGEGNTTYYTYETTFNKVKTIKDPLDGATKFDYDTNGNLITITDANDKTTTITYYSNGLVHTITNRNNATTTYEYDSYGKMIKQTDDLDNETTYTYDDAGNMTSVTNVALDSTTMYEYDVMNNLKGISYPEGGHISFANDAMGNRKSMIDPNGNTTQYEYDKKDRLTKIIDPLGNEITYSYDRNGNLLTRKDASGITTTYRYNELERLIEEIDTLDHITKYTYDPVGNLTSITDARENTTYYVYDYNNRMTKIIEPLNNETLSNNETLFEYDKNDNLTSITDAKGQTTSFEYDKLNRKISMINHLEEQETYEYYDNGNLKQKTLFNNETITYEYDNIDRLKKKILSTGGTTSYDYDEAGNITGVTNPYSSLYFDYDKNNRLITASTYPTAYQPGTTITYTYDSVGNRVSMTVPFYGVTTYTYDERNNLSSVKTPNNQTTSFEYYENNQRKSNILPNNLISGYDYNPNGDLDSLDHTLEASIISGYSYEYDDVGNRTRMTESAGIHDYAYDELNQLIQADHPQISPESYTYDPVGNRSSSAISSSWDYDETNKLLDDGDFTYQYTNGCLTRKTNKSTSEVTTYTYNSENQLIGINNNIFYYYDGLGRRICKEVDGVKAYYIYDDEDILYTLDDSYTVISRYTHGPGIDEPIQMDQEGAIYYFLRDGLGSITQVVDSSGNIQQEYTYDSFGKIVNQSGSLDNPYTYTGREYDPESGLYYYRARYYDPQTGRFLSPDPIGFAGGDLNLYRYVWNNPVNLVDPWGLYVIEQNVGIPLLPELREGPIYPFGSRGPIEEVSPFGDPWGHRIKSIDYVIHNKLVIEQLKKFNLELVRQGYYGNDVEIIVTGGDRCIGIYQDDTLRFYDDTFTHLSATNKKPVRGSSPTSPHLISRGARGLDFWVEGVPKDVVEEAIKGTAFVGFKYSSNPKHYHVNLPNKPEYYYRK